MQFIFVVIAWRTCSPGLHVIICNNVVIGSGTASVQLHVEGELCQDSAARTCQTLQMTIASWWSISMKTGVALGVFVMVN